MFFLFAFLSTISRQPAGRFMPNFACGRILVPGVSSPLLGLAAPAGRKDRKLNFHYYRSQWVILAFWWFLSNISATRGRIGTKFYLYRDNACRRAPSPSGVHQPLEGGETAVKNSKMGVVLFVLWTATISIFLSVAKCGSICRAQICRHSGVEPSRSAKTFVQGGLKSSKKNSNFSPFRDFTSLHLRNY